MVIVCMNSQSVGNITIVNDTRCSANETEAYSQGSVCIENNQASFFVLFFIAF